MRRRRPPLVPLLILGALLPAPGGCGLIGGPRNSANIELRKENQTLRDQVATLERQVQENAAVIRSREEASGTLQTLPRERLGRLFTTHDVKLGRLTGGADLDPRRPGHEGLKVYVTPTDGDGDPLKAAGAFTVEAFDVAAAGGPARVGAWAFDVEAARRQWSSVLNRYNYVLTCPWQSPPPRGGSLHVVVTFVDELTGGTFKKSVDVTVEAPAGEAPATAPATAPDAPTR
jgi:hypothetical protein